MKKLITQRRARTTATTNGDETVASGCHAWLVTRRSRLAHLRRSRPSRVALHLPTELLSILSGQGDLGRETRASFTSSRIEASFNRGWMTNETVSCEDR